MNNWNSGDFLYESYSNTTSLLAEEILKAAARKDARVATAESLTGGMLAASLVSVAGASTFFNGGVVAYNTELKHSLLGVESGLLSDHGPVHPDVAESMARGAYERCSVREQTAIIGIATTGVAGPDPDDISNQPVGVVFIGIASESGTRNVRLLLSGTREEIRRQVVVAALEELLRELS
ncbi:CinA family protein [Lysinibacter sp. HNR]|uniref:CinA family protein n=1 Tax=Lysinibacter sp. HNR TaxID=3031408 RepID=UPI00243508A4|nr:CinA family protein [Lysinibacter sp. HNR]WGD38274.1 CinA family protein [Lysinibacter sp. HNR]